MWIAGVERSRAIDRRAMQEFGIPSMVLMERAGTAVFEVVRQMLPEGGSLAALCGRGNNGGDGFVVARLAQERGYRAECIVAAPEAELRGEGLQQMLQAKAAGVQITFAGDERWAQRLECLKCKQVLVDALLGIGAKGAVRGAVQECIRAIGRSGAPVVAVDVPSGIDADTGEELGESVWATRTVTFGLPKPFLFQGVGLEHSGCWGVADLGYPSELLDESTGIRLLSEPWAGCLMPERPRGSHKGANGHVLIVAGSRRYRGAASLAALGALRAGAGLVTVAGIEPVCAAAAALAPEAIYLPLPEADGAIAPEAADVLKQNAHRYDAAVVGPGMAFSETTVGLLTALFPTWTLPSCIDADALNAISQGAPAPAGPCVLTPHPGEMGRLLNRTVAEVQADRFGAVRRAAERFGKAVLLKGAHSLVAAPGEETLVNFTGNPGMASGGMGDVLSGVVATLLAQDLPPATAAGVAMVWHGKAADLCAETEGEVGYLAHNVADALPQARAKLAASCLGDC